MAIQAFAVHKAGKRLEPFVYEFAEDLGANEVEIEVSHCGVCHSDLHLIDNDWQMTEYPLVPGHEIIGEVTKLGDQIKHLPVGARVGVGWQRGACLHCEFCLRGEENLCRENQVTIIGSHGGFADRIRVDGRFAYPIPQALSSENAAPLLCAGITAYAPLREHKIQAPMRVGIIGVGGLGHLAIQFARAFGCHVTAFSTSKDKRREAKRFGAHHFIFTQKTNPYKDLAASFDFLLSTVSGDLDWNEYLELLKPGGKLCLAGAPASELQINPGSLITGRKTLCGSSTGPRGLMQEMLQFAASNGIEAQTEVVPLMQVNDAIQKLRDNQARYRMVLKIG